MNDDEPIYTVAQVADALDTPGASVRSYLQRKQISLLETDKPSEGNGFSRLLSMRSALHIGVFVSLVRLSVPTEKANEAATFWLHFGVEGRDVGGLYSTPFTVLCVYPNALPDIVHSRLKAIKDENGKIIEEAGKASDLFFSQSHGMQPGATFLILDYIDKQVRTRLAEQPLRKFVTLRNNGARSNA